MNAPSKFGIAGLFRFAIIEVLVVLIGMVFVRREVYMGGHFGEMVLHWQEYALLALSFIDGLVRGQTRALYSSPFRKKVLRYFLPFALFLYVACSSLCDKLNVGCIREEWFRDLGLGIMGGGLILLIIAQRTRPNALLTARFVQDQTSINPPGDGAITTGPVTRNLNASQLSEEGAAEGKAVTAAENKVEDADPVVEKDSDPKTEAESELKPGEPESSPKTGPTANQDAKPSSSDPSGQTDLRLEAQVPPEHAFLSDHVRGPWRYLRYPTRTAILLELIGISMSLAAWMPIFTLPGLIILFKWELADLEAFRISQFGDEYVKYKNRTWYLVPYVY